MGMVSATSPTSDETFDMFQNAVQHDSRATFGVPLLLRFVQPSFYIGFSSPTIIPAPFHSPLADICSSSPDPPVTSLLPVTTDTPSSSTNPLTLLLPVTTDPSSSSTDPSTSLTPVTTDTPSTPTDPPTSLLLVTTDTPPPSSSSSDPPLHSSSSSDPPLHSSSSSDPPLPSVPFPTVISSPSSISSGTPSASASGMKTMSSSASLLPTTDNKPANASIPVGAIIGGVVGGMVALFATTFLLWRCSSQRRAGHRNRTNTNLAPLHVTPFHGTPSGPIMAETNNHTPNTYNLPMTSSLKSNPFSSPNDPSAVGVRGITARIWNLSGRKASPRASPILRMYEDSGMRGVTDEVVDVPPSYTSQ